MQKEALFWKHVKKNTVQCELCPRFCVIRPGERGNCGVRENHNGKLITLVYGKAVSASLDPIEKKPLYHFLPNHDTLSIATAGCNLHCLYCQNYSISQCRPEDAPAEHLPPANVVEECIRAGSKIISYTYTEPTIFYEYAFDTAKLAKKEKLKNVFVSNGFINSEPLKKIIPLIDAANIDLKGNEKYYRKITGGWIKPVLETLKELKKNKVWIEVTNLVVPTLNDSPNQIKWLADWIAKNLGKDVPLHFSAFWPTYKLTKLPHTTLQKLKNARIIAMKSGLRYVYTGNVDYEEGNNTYCPKCKQIVVKRKGFYTTEIKLKNGRCGCGERIAGVWE